MLNDYQILVVRRAMVAAVDKDAEIKRIAKGMKVEESEIQQVLAQMPREEPAASSNPEPSSRLVWTTKQLEQLHQLRAEKKGPTEIAHIMGLKAHQVQSKLHSEKKSRAAATSSTPVKAEPEPNSDDPPTVLLGLPPEPEPAACEAESPDIPEPPIQESPFSEEDSEPDFAPASESRAFILASEIMRLIKYLEYSYPPVSMGLLQANQEVGWAVCHFSAAGSEYVISLRRKGQNA